MIDYVINASAINQDLCLGCGAVCGEGVGAWTRVWRGLCEWIIFINDRSSTPGICILCMVDTCTS